MYCRKSVGPRLEPWETPQLTLYSCEGFWSRTTQSQKAKYVTWNSIIFKFEKKASIPNPVKSLGYIKCCSSSSPRPVKSLFNSTRYHCQKICSWSRRPKTILEIRKKSSFRWLTSVLITSLLFTLKERLKNIHKLKKLTPNGLNQDFNQSQVMPTFTMHNGRRPFMVSLVTGQIFTVQL